MFSRARDMAGRPQSVFDYMCRLLVPLCAARAAEAVLYGRDSMTLSTASEVRRLLLRAGRFRTTSKSTHVISSAL